MQIKDTEQKRITIIGAGAAGLATAWELAEKGYLVEVLEYRGEILEGSSDDTPCRLGLGFHYIDKATAIKYLQATVDFVKKYPEFIVAGDKPNDHPYRRGRYIVVKNSVFNFSQIQDVYEALKNEYGRLVQEDPTNAVFGDPEKFYHFLTLDEYEKDVNKNVVLAGIETAEQILDWPRFKEFYSQKIKSHPNIIIRNHTQVLGIAQNDKGFTVKTQSTKDQKPEEIRTNFIINSAWENIEELSNSAGFSPAPGVVRTNRLKVILEVKLPPGFETPEHPVNSLFCCFGPHAAFTNVSDGKGFISYEPLTNVGASTALQLPDSFKQIMYGNLSDEEKFVIAEKIHRAENISNIVIHYLSNIDENKKRLLASDLEKLNELSSSDLIPRVFEEQSNLIKVRIVEVLLKQVEEFLSTLSETQKSKLFDDIEEKGVSAKNDFTKKLSAVFNDHFSKLPEEQKFELADKINLGIIKNYPQRIIDKVAGYIKMAGAKYVKPKFGIVKTYGSARADIYSANSQVHKRDDYNIQEPMVGLTTNPSMKLLYLLKNAEINKRLISDHVTIMDALDQVRVDMPESGYNNDNEFNTPGAENNNNSINNNHIIIENAITKSLHFYLRSQERVPSEELVPTQEYGKDGEVRTTKKINHTGKTIQTAEIAGQIAHTVQNTATNKTQLVAEFKEHCSDELAQNTDNANSVFPKPKKDYYSGFFRDSSNIRADLSSRNPVTNKTKLVTEFKKHCSDELAQNTGSTNSFFPQPKKDYHSGFFRAASNSNNSSDTPLPLPPMVKSKSADHETDDVQTIPAPLVRTLSQ